MYEINEKPTIDHLQIADILLQESRELRTGESQSLSSIIEPLKEKFDNLELYEEPGLTEQQKTAIEKHRLVEIASQIVGRPYIIDNDNKDIIANLFKYFRRDNTSSYNLDKWIFLHGYQGTGKTDLMRTFQVYLYECISKEHFEFITASDLWIKCQKDISILNDFINKNHICIDDIGTESKLKSYGNEVDIVEQIIHERYNRKNSVKSKIHFTTNFQLKDLFSRYDGRAVDRLQEICNFIPMNGKNRRISS